MKFVHIGDVHFDAPFRVISDRSGLGEERRLEQRKAFKSAMSQVLELLIKIIVTIILLQFYTTTNVETICIYLILADIISEICSCIFSIILVNSSFRSIYDCNLFIKSDKFLVSGNNGIIVSVGTPPTSW